MTRVMAVTFERYGRLYHLDAGQHEIAVGDWVLVPSGEGTEVAQCVWGPTDVEWSGELPACGGIADDAALARDADNRRRRAEIQEVAKRLIAKHHLPMKVVAVDFVDNSPNFDQQSVIYFEAPVRVDFRALLTDLARSLKSRIDLRQVGSRDAAALLGGVAACGREFCCALMRLPREPVAMRLARSQDLTSNPLQIAGSCGRLMCCLAYEHPLYTDFHSRAPAVGTDVTTPEGDGVVVGHSVPLDSVVVKLAEGQFNCPVSDACPVASGRQPARASTRRRS